jgi:hypothetical protein
MIPGHTASIGEYVVEESADDDPNIDAVTRFRYHRFKALISPLRHADETIFQTSNIFEEPKLRSN